jgi:hypothetical protein
MKFESEMSRAQAMRDAEPERSEYWAGYQRGLRRAHHGSIFGTAEEHQLWFSIPNEEPDLNRRQRGQGYRDGLKYPGTTLPPTASGRRGGNPHGGVLAFLAHDN